MEYDPEGVVKTRITQVQEHDFIRDRFLGIGKNSELQGWVVQYGVNSCMMGKVRFIIPRLVIGVFAQFICSYSTLPLYAFVTQEHIREGLVGWARKAKKNNKGNAFKRSANGSSQVGLKEESPLVLEMAEVDEKESAV